MAGSHVRTTNEREATMQKLIAERRRSQEGFTLIELLIVIVILGILAAVVVFAVGGITDRGNESACAADKKTLEVAQEAYYAKNSEYATEAELVDDELIREQSDLYNTDASGDVVPQDDECEEPESTTTTAGGS